MVGSSSAATGGSAQTNQAAEASSNTPDYVIGAGDVLQIFVWKEAELTREVTVRVDGKITLPLLGDVEAAGHTPVELAEQMQTALGRFLSSPRVTVGVNQAKSTRFYVLGQVAKPGEYPLGPQMTVLQGLALAGGLREFAKGDGIVIVRHGTPPEKQRLIPVDYSKIKDGKDISQNVALKPGDTIVVP
jgi:polysaccharide export outer membrane protein